MFEELYFKVKSAETKSYAVTSWAPFREIFTRLGCVTIEDIRKVCLDRTLELCNLLFEVFEELSYSRTSVYKHVNGIRIILNMVEGLTPGLIERIKPLQKAVNDAPTTHIKNLQEIMPLSVRNDEENVEVVRNWCMRYTNIAKIKSIMTMRQILYQILNKVVPVLSVNIVDRPSLSHVTAELLLENASIFPSERQLRWFKVFLETTCDDWVHLEPVLSELMHKLSRKLARDSEVVGDNDTHLICGADLDKMFNASKELGVVYHLLFMLLITTGMRIGGAASIQLSNIGTWKDDKFTVNATGFTVEKGHKKFTFAISERVADYIGRYIKTSRPMTNLDYLFITPRSGYYTPSNLSIIFNRIKKHANLEDKQNIHPHAMRHSYAHILMENGNDVYTVSKMLGHSSVQTTEKFYLKETAADVSKRANVPWLSKDHIESERKTPVFMEKMAEKENRAYNKVSSNLRRRIRENIGVV